ncbi:MAG TPA: hypothetical protein VJK54_07275 [Chthoniobacterales bacterium]|nr:hypothetical protein [Chthoniobacterales bacterium]
MKTSFSIFLIFLSLLFSSLSSLFAQMNSEEINKAEEALGFSSRLSFPSNTSILTTAQRVSSIEGENSINAVVAEQKNAIENSAKILTQADSSNCNVAKGKVSNFQENIKTDDGENILDVIGNGKNINLKSCAEQQQMNGMSNEMKKKALSLCCDKWLVETQPSKILLDYELLKEDENYSLVKTFEEYWNKVAKAHELGNDSLALSWIQIAKDIQQALEDSIKKVQASKNEENASRDTEYPWTNITIARQKWDEVSERYSEAIASLELEELLHWEEVTKTMNNSIKRVESWHHTAVASRQLAEYRKKYIEAEESHEVPEIIKYWKQIVEISQSFADYCRQAAEALTSGKEQEYHNLEQTAKFLKENISQLVNAVNSLKDSIDAIAEGELEMSIFWRKIATQWIQSVEYNKQILNPGLNLETGIETGDLSQYTLPQNVLSDLSHVRTPKRHGEPGLKVCHGSVKTILEQTPYEISSSSISVSRLNKNFTCRNLFFQREHYMSCHFSQLKSASFALKKSIEARKLNEKELVELWFKIARQHEESAEYFYKTVDDLGNGANTAATNAKKAAYNVIRSVEQLETASISLGKAIRAERWKQEEFAAILFKITKQREESAGYYIQAACFQVNENNDCNYFNKAAKSAELSADQFKNVFTALEKAIPAKEANQEQLAERWFQTVKQYEESAEYYRRSAEAYAIGNKEEGDRLGGNSSNEEGLAYVAMKEANILKEQAEEFEKQNH